MADAQTEESPIDPALLRDANQALKVAKVTLMMQRNTVFYTTILFSLRQEMTEEVPTAATDGRFLYINPKFFMDLSPNERLSLLCHEVLHVALDHMHRRGERDPRIWNIAGDYVINESLAAAGYNLPENGLRNTEYHGKTTEQVYDVIYKKPESSQAKIFAECPEGSWNGGDVQYPENQPDDKQVPQKEVTQVVLRATTQAKAMNQAAGSIPGEVEIGLQRTLNPPLPWHVILRNHMTEFAKDDYSFTRPNRRFLPDYYLPTAHSEAIPNIAIAVDTSGSVSDEQFNTFITKIEEIQQQMTPKKVTVIAFDTQLKNVQELEQHDNPFKKLSFSGRGGTRIQPVHEWVDENKPTMIVIFTDGHFNQVKPKDPTIPMFWIIHNNPGWNNGMGGEVIHYDIEL